MALCHKSSDELSEASAQPRNSVVMAMVGMYVRSNFAQVCFLHVTAASPGQNLAICSWLTATPENTSLGIPEDDLAPAKHSPGVF